MHLHWLSVVYEKMCDVLCDMYAKWLVLSYKKGLAIFDDLHSNYDLFYKFIILFHKFLFLGFFCLPACGLDGTSNMWVCVFGMLRCSRELLVNLIEALFSRMDCLSVGVKLYVVRWYVKMFPKFYPVFLFLPCCFYLLLLFYHFLFLSFLLIS